MLLGLNASWLHYAIDGVVILVAFIFAVKSAKKGFVDCFFGFVSTILAIIAAFTFMKGLLAWTDGLFGLQGAIENGLIGAFGKVKGFDVDVSAAGMEQALEDKNLPSFLINAIVDNVANKDVPIGTTLAMIVGGTLGEFAATLVAWFAVFLIAKFLLKLVRKFLNSLIQSLPIVGGINRLLGFIVGAIKGLLIVCVVVAIIALIPSAGLTTFFSETIVAGWLYNSNPLHVILGWIIT